MNSNLLVIIDASGSMNEWGKRDLIINIIVTILQNSNPNFIFWNDTITPANITSLDDFEDINSINLDFKGEAKLDILHDYLVANFYDKTILISDGNLTLNRALDFSNFNITCFTCGVDSISSNLNSVFKTKTQNIYNILNFLN